MKTLKSRLKEGLSTAYILFGEDFELYSRAYKMILKRTDLQLPDFNLVRYDDENFSMKGVLDGCEVLPMGDNFRVIVLKNISKVSDKDLNLLENYLKNPQNSTILVIFDYYGQFVTLKDKMQCVDCKRFDRPTATAVVVNELAKRGKQISSEGASVLLDYCNGYLTRVMCELDKLAYFDLAEPLITRKMVEELVSKDSEAVVFELTEALGRRDGDKAIALLEEFKKEPGLLGLITNHFRRLFYIGISDLSERELASLLGVKEYAIQKQKSQVKNFSKMQLKKIYSLLERVDYMIKSGEMLNENALQFLVLSILYI
ncbi:MAG: DNA polymerase III subunit delta [Clostridia bacterium]|nr:DNA polymerase III subunit delta [Clostridia bacterium]